MIINLSSLPVGKQRTGDRQARKKKERKKKTKMQTERGSTIGFSPQTRLYDKNILFPMVSEGGALLRMWLLSNRGVWKGRANLPYDLRRHFHVSRAIQSGTFVPQVAASRWQKSSHGRKQILDATPGRFQGVLGDRQLMASSLLVYLTMFKMNRDPGVRRVTLIQSFTRWDAGE